MTRHDAISETPNPNPAQNQNPNPPPTILWCKPLTGPDDLDSTTSSEPVSPFDLGKIFLVPVACAGKRKRKSRRAAGAAHQIIPSLPSGDGVLLRSITLLSCTQCATRSTCSRVSPLLCSSIFPGLGLGLGLFLEGKWMLGSSQRYLVL